MQIRHDTHRYEFLVETCRTERREPLAAWSQVPDDRKPVEQMVHQYQIHCVDN